MDEISIKREICILLCHYLKHKAPDVYRELASFCKENDLLMPGSNSIDEELNIRFESFPPDQFYNFIKVLRPADDFPSIFRRITKFEPKENKFAIKSYSPVCRVFGHSEAIYCLSIDPLSRFIATASDDMMIKIWSIPDLRLIHRMAGHEAVITNICINSLCSLLLSSSDDKTIRLWSLKTGKTIGILGGFTTETVHYAIFSPSGSLIAAACEDGTIPVWTTKDALLSRPPIRTLRSPGRSGAAAWLTFSPGGEFLCFSTEPSNVVVTPLKTMNSQLLECHGSLADQVQFSQKYTTYGGDIIPRLLTVSNEDGACAIWILEGTVWKPQHVFRHNPGQGRRTTKIHKLGWDCNEHMILIAKTNAVYVCDSITGETIGTIQQQSLAFDNCSVVVGNPVYPEIFFLANNNGSTCIVDISTLSVVCELRCNEDAAFTEGVWSKDGQYIYATDSCGSVTQFIINRKYQNDTTIIEMFISTDLGIDGEPFFCTKQGQKLVEQPQVYDIRMQNFPLTFVQGPLLRNSVIELKLIQRIANNERHAISSSTSSAVVPPPPQHIPISNEYPVNPHGNMTIDLYANSELEDEQTAQFKIQSDPDDWQFEPDDIKEDDEPEPEISPILQSNYLPKDIWPSWVTAYSVEDSMFLPQVGDEMFFIKSAYQKMLTEAKIDDPLENSDLIQEISRSLITDIEIDEYGMKLCLTILNNSDPSSRVETHAHYQIPEVFTYMMPLMKFKNLFEQVKDIKVNDKVTVPFDDDNGGVKNYTGVVSAINDGWQAMPFESITVIWNAETNDVSVISPWDIIALNEKPLFYVGRSLLLGDVESSIIGILDSLFDEPRFSCFKTFPDIKEHPEYVNKVQLPMSLMLIRERLENAWYRNMRGISSDVRLFVKNVQQCVEDKEVFENAQAAGNMLLDSLKDLSNKLIEREKKRRTIIDQKKS